MILNCRFYIIKGNIRIFFRARFENDFPQPGERIPIVGKCVYFWIWDPAKHWGIKIPSFRILRRIDIAGNIQVILISPNFVQRHYTRKFFNIFALNYGVNYTFYVWCAKLVVFSDLLKTFWSVYYQNVILASLLFQDHYNRWNSRPEENISGKPNNCVYMVFFYQVFADFFLFTASE